MKDNYPICNSEKVVFGSDGAWIPYATGIELEARVVELEASAFDARVFLAESLFCHLYSCKICGLKPEPILADDCGFVQLRCDCGAAGSWAKTIDEACSHWNKLAFCPNWNTTGIELEARVAELEAALAYLLEQSENILSETGCAALITAPELSTIEEFMVAITAAEFALPD